MTTTHRRTPARVAIIIDVYDEPLLTVLIWARQSAHTLTTQLWDHGILAHIVRIDIDAYPTLNR
jgi:hypothetical protein